MLTRRDLLKGAAVMGASTLPLGAGGCSSESDDGSDAPEPLGPETLFSHGVASGDPLPDAVILWTRVSPAPQHTGPVRVRWSVARDTELTQMVASGSTVTDESRDFTVKVDATGLEPGTTFYYRFTAQQRQSPIGRTKTAPTGGVERLRFAVASCASVIHGYFHVYRSIAERDVDAVIHLGDYIYEYGFAFLREFEPAHEIITLAEYRMRHAQYKREPELQEAHRQHPFIVVWDDHETANNSWREGAENHDPTTEGDWTERKAAGIQAFLEWMPIREAQPKERIFRKLGFGDLVDLVLLDTRLWGRDEPGGEAGPPPPEDPNVSLLGDDQADWLEQQLGSSQAKWKIIGQQVMLANLFIDPNNLANLDQWHGYPASRRRLLEFLRDSNVQDVVVLTGDIHSSWASEIVLDPGQYDEGRASLAVEFVTPGVTASSSFAAIRDAIEAARPYNPHIRWFDLERRGHVLIDVTPARVQAVWYLRDDIADPVVSNEVVAGVWSVGSGETILTEDAQPAPPPTSAPPPAP